MADRSGQQLDNYRLIRLLGKGTFGEVYLGENIYRKTQVAVKVLQMHLSKEEFFSFINEARIFRLRHPHIVSVLDFGVERSSEIPFIVMDYAPNGTLRLRHPLGTPLPLATVVEYVKQIAAALQHAHEENLVHRDVKPENMLVGAKDEILLSDFGIAVVTQSGRTTMAGEQGMAGTPYYMAPEQIRGKLSRASDQYALGIIVYEWLSGARPFNGTMYELFGQHIQVTPPPLPTSLAMSSPELEQVVMKALAKDPKSRFANVQEFAAALEEAYKKIVKANQAPTVLVKTKEQWVEEGIEHRKAQRYEEAIAAYSRAIELDPNYALVYYNRGNAYHQLQEYRKAMADYNRAIELKPNYAYAYNNRGNAYGDLQEYEKAIADYSRAIELKPNYALAYRNRGNAYHHLQKYVQTIADYDRAIELNPNDAAAYYNRGNVYGDLQEYEKAIADYGRAIELNPNDAVAYYNRGNVYDDLQEYEKAIADYDRAIELNPNDADAYYNRGLAYYHHRQYRKAIADYDRAIELNPNYTYAYYNRGLAYRNLQEYRKAIADYDRAIELDPNDADAYTSRGLAYYDLKEYQKAIEDYDRALALDPNHSRARNNREQALQQLKK